MPNHHTLRCKCCQSSDILQAGELDFNKSCHDRFGSRVFPISDIMVPYFHCLNCGFRWTNFMDKWTSGDFKKHIYNADYLKADADIPGSIDEKIRLGLASAEEGSSHLMGLSHAFLIEGNANNPNFRCLDYGSGEASSPKNKALKSKGFDIEVYEPFRNDEANVLPGGKFQFIYIDEVIEHCCNLDLLRSHLAEKLADDGIFRIGGLIFLKNQIKIGDLSHWYIAPRNGHISIFTMESLYCLFRPLEISIAQTIWGVVGFKNIPKFKNAFFCIHGK